MLQHGFKGALWQCVEAELISKEADLSVLNPQ